MSREELAKIRLYLRDKGVAINIDACGCCESPWISLLLPDGTVLESSEDNLEMFREEDDTNE